MTIGGKFSCLLAGCLLPFARRRTTTTTTTTGRLVMLVDDKCHFLTFGHREIVKRREREKTNKNKTSQRAYLRLTRRPFQRMNNCRPVHKTFWALNTVNTHTPNVLFSFQKMREKKPLCSLNSHTRTESNTGHTAHKHTSEKSFFSVICLNQKKI